MIDNDKVKYSGWPAPAEQKKPKAEEPKKRGPGRPPKTVEAPLEGQ